MKCDVVTWLLQQTVWVINVLDPFCMCIKRCLVVIKSTKLEGSAGCISRKCCLWCVSLCNDANLSCSFIGRCVKALVKCEADLEKECLQGRTPLYLACEQGHVECVKVLLDAGADRSHVTTVSFQFLTPVSLKCQLHSEFLNTLENTGPLLISMVTLTVECGYFAVYVLFRM